MELSHVIYNSATTVAMDEASLLTLLEKSRRNNAAVDVTGMLLYSEGSFFQVLEGPTEAVEAVAARIEQDPRHDRMTVIIKEPIHKRSFGEWTMGFANVAPDELSDIQGRNDFFEGQHVLADVTAGRARKLLSAFAQGRWHFRITNPLPSPSPAPSPALVPTRAPASSVAAPTTRPPFSIAFQPIVDISARTVFAYGMQLRGPDGESEPEVLQRVAIEEIDAFDSDTRRCAIDQAVSLGLRSSLYLPFVPRLSGATTASLASMLCAAEQQDFDPNRLILEINHEVSLIDPHTIAAALRDFRARGVRISIGDFGSGHAGLGLLEYYQPDAISLSMWLVRGIEGSGPRQAIVRGLVQTCADLGIDIIATGVSSSDEFSWLEAEGLTIFQGQLFAGAEVGALPRPSLPIQ